jgi:hypothetical protein
MLGKVKKALRMVTDAYDDELNDLIESALADLGVAGVSNMNTYDPLVRKAVITYVRCNFGEPDEYDRLKASYDEQKAQLSMHTGHTNWGGVDG